MEIRMIFTDIAYNHPIYCYRPIDYKKITKIHIKNIIHKSHEI